MDEDSQTCACGHVKDEHDETWACTVDGCNCFYFEADDAEEP